MLNIELKARCKSFNEIREKLIYMNADFKGIDFQIDTDFNAPNGRLKLREGNIEQALIYYQRENITGPKESNVTLYQPQPDATLKVILSKSLGILVIVDKKREIYFIDNVKFHLDDVKNLGKFVEIEAIDKEGNIGRQRLQRQCEYYLKEFNIDYSDFISNSYSDTLLNLGNRY